MGQVANIVKDGSQVKSSLSSTFSPFTPSTYSELNKEIANLTSNLEFIDQTCNTPVRKHSLIEKTIDHSLYLLDQKRSHLDAVRKLAANTSISEKDYDSLREEFCSLKKSIDDLSGRIEDLSYRSLGKK
jgi:hypothetical protein